MLSAFLGTVLLALTGTLHAAPGDPLPEVQVTRRRPAGLLLSSGASRPFFGTVDETRALFKSNSSWGPVLGPRAMLHGNVEGEWLASRLMQEAGVASPRVEAVRIAGKPGSYAQVQHLEELFPGQRLFRSVDELPKDARVDLAAVQRVQAMDVLMGNADRHTKNLWFAQDPKTGVLKPIAFDHNVALASRTLTGRKQTTNFSAFEMKTTHTTAGGTTLPQPITSEVMTRNRAYSGGLWDSKRAFGLLTEARAVEGAISEARIRELVASIPDEAIGAKDKVARRKELTENLLRRRRELVPTAEAFLRQQPDYLRTQLELARLPAEMRAKLPQDLDGRWRFVEALGPDGKFVPDRLQAAFAAAGLSRETATRATRTLLPGAVLSGRVPVVASTKTPTWGELRATKSPFKGQVPSYDFLEYTQGRDGKATVTSIDGGPAAPETHPSRRVLATAVGNADLKPGERLVVSKSGSLLGGYSAEILGPDGDARGNTRYHPVGTKVVKTGGPARSRQVEKNRRPARKVQHRETPGSRARAQDRYRPRIGGRR